MTNLNSNNTLNSRGAKNESHPRLSRLHSFSLSFHSPPTHPENIPHHLTTTINTTTTTTNNNNDDNNSSRKRWNHSSRQSHRRWQLTYHRCLRPHSCVGPTTAGPIPTPPSAFPTWTTFSSSTLPTSTSPPSLPQLHVALPWPLIRLTSPLSPHPGPWPTSEACLLTLISSRVSASELVTRKMVLGTRGSAITGIAIPWMGLPRRRLRLTPPLML